MEVLKQFPAIALTVLLVTVSCFSSEESEHSEGVSENVNTANSLNPPQTVETDQLQYASEENGLRANIEDGDSACSETQSVPSEERNCQDEDTHAAKIETEGSEVKSSVKRNDACEGESDSDTEDNAEKRIPPSKVFLQAFGHLEAGDEQTDESSEGKEEEIWTEQTEDGTDQKRSGGRRFFSLMNLIKFLLNPVIEEFQEMEKSSTGQDASATTDSNNQSDVAGVATGNSSDVAEKEEKNSTDSSKKTKFQCVGRNVTENTTAVVKIVNSTILLELLSFDKNHSLSDCVLVMFYAPWCHFCAATAPHYNAVARAFPQLEVLAVDTVHFSNLNARFGTVAVPNIMLFHQSRSAVRFNHTERHFHTLLEFITNTTGLEANSSVELSPEDYEGPLSSIPTEETDYLLWFAWFFILVCSGHIFIFSQVGQRAIERVVVLWQEHQHQHIE
ncbi:uncharacterized protein LOC143286711 isoform X2 [Babylonia areolata]|uniref:uncharacterized protein LOC143286711 isoform X2 n=1 Tax=Babylonia areolata TaxID=304850 RepID=UPI003FD50E46